MFTLYNVSTSIHYWRRIIIQLEECIIAFLEHILIRNTTATVMFYIAHLRSVYNYLHLHGVKSLSEVLDDFTLGFITIQKRTGVTNSTINKRIDCLKRLFKHFKVMHTLVTEKPLKKQNIRFKIVHEYQLKQIINYIYHLPDDEKSLYDKLIVMLLLETGVRINELLCIERCNVDLKSQCILLTKTKTNVNRYVYFKDYTKSLLTKYLSIECYDHPYLLNHFGYAKQLTYKYIVILFQKIKNTYGIKSLSPHMFRHTCATFLIENDAPINAVQKLLGHTSIKTTERYIHESQKKIKNDFMKYFPDLIN